MCQLDLAGSHGLTKSQAAKAQDERQQGVGRGGFKVLRGPFELADQLISLARLAKVDICIGRHQPLKTHQPLQRAFQAIARQPAQAQAMNRAGRQAFADLDSETGVFGAINRQAPEALVRRH